MRTELLGFPEVVFFNSTNQNVIFPQFRFEGCQDLVEFILESGELGVNEQVDITVVLQQIQLDS